MKTDNVNPYRYRNLYSRLDERFIGRCFAKLNKRAASGVDGVSYIDYGRDLVDNVSNLVGRLKEKVYRARLVKRQYIPKSGGKLRPLGMPVLEDKLLRTAASLILGEIREREFLPSSCGYRPDVGAESGVRQLLTRLRNGRFNYVVEADIKGFFDNIDHDWLLRMLAHRIEDSAFPGLIRKWLKAGVPEEDGKVINPVTGTPQGGVISPILANIYLHYVLDLWFRKIVGKRCKGRIFFVRYADDFVCLFQYKEDAELFFNELPERMAKFGLELAPDKTRIIAFNGKPGTQRFRFLGFEFYRGKTVKGKLSTFARTSPEKMTASLKRFKAWIRRHVSLGAAEIFSRVRAILIGHYNYFGISGNFKMLDNYSFRLKLILRKYLNRRSQRRSCNWEKFQTWLPVYKIPRPRITWR